MHCGFKISEQFKFPHQDLSYLRDFYMILGVNICVVNHFLFILFPESWASEAVILVLSSVTAEGSA
mgnify:CR=1 FL=1